MARKMKDSGIEWIGEIPEGWEVVPAKRLCTMQAGKNLTSEQIAPEGTYPVYGGNGTRGFFSDYNCDGHFLTVGRQGALCGNVHKVNGKVWATEHAVITTPSSYTSLDFLYYLLIGMDLNQYVSSTAAQPGLAVGTLLNLKTCYPCSTLEQTQISNYLNAKCSEIDVMLSKTHSSIEEYKKLKQAVITQAVTKGVRGERGMKDSGVEWIGEIPKEWVCEKIKYATSISRGLFNHRPRNDERYYNGKYPFIQTGDVANATKYIVSYSQTLNELGKSVSKEFPKGTLTMTIAANVGDVAILNFDAYFPDSVVGFIPNKNIRTLYLFYVFSAMKDEFTRTAIKSTQLNLNIDRVKETFIPVTHDSNEQCEIENYLESKCAEIDGLIAKKEQLVKELESYKKSLIYEVVTGKREV